MKRRHFVSLMSVVALAVAMLAGWPGPRAQATLSLTSLIVPQASIGPAKLGAGDAVSLSAALGKGAVVAKTKDQVSLRLPTGMLVARLYKGQVVDIETTSPAFATKSAVHVGSPASAVKSAYGNALQSNGSSLFLVGTKQK